MKKVLFICLGNICRSPMAEGIFQQMVIDADLEAEIMVDSAGTGGWHTGDRAHPGTRAILKKHSIPYSGRSRQVDAHDMRDKETFIIAMDQSNVETLRARHGDHPRLYKLLAFASNTTDSDVPDPYYTGGFDTVYELVEDGCRGLLEYILKS